MFKKIQYIFLGSVLSFGGIRIEECRQEAYFTATKAFEGSKIEDPLQLEMLEAVGRNYLKDNTHDRADINRFHLDEKDKKYYLSIQTTSFLIPKEEMIDRQRTVSWSVVDSKYCDFLYKMIHRRAVDYDNSNIENEEDAAMVRKFQEDIAKIAHLDEDEPVMTHFEDNYVAVCYKNNLSVYKKFSLCEIFKSVEEANRFEGIYIVLDRKIRVTDGLIIQRENDYKEFLYRSFVGVASKVYDMRETDFRFFLRHFLSYMGTFDGFVATHNVHDLTICSLEKLIDGIPNHHAVYVTNDYTHLKDGLLKIIQDK